MGANRTVSSGGRGEVRESPFFRSITLWKENPTELEIPRHLLKGLDHLKIESQTKDVTLSKVITLSYFVVLQSKRDFYLYCPFYR